MGLFLIFFATKSLYEEIPNFWNELGNWTKVEAQLIDVIVSDRTIKGEADQFFMLTYSYMIGEESYFIYERMGILSTLSIERQTEEIKNLWRVRNVFYKESSPSINSFSRSFASTELIVVLLILIGVGLLLPRIKPADSW